jgi:restriction system protein
MRHEQNRLWVMRSGREEEAHHAFVMNKYLSLGWKRLADLRKLEPKRKAFISKFRRHYPDEKPGAVKIQAGELFRFVYKMNSKDFVVYPSATDELVHFGRVAGPYKHRRGQNPHFPHCRKVKWFRNVPNEALPRQAQRAIHGRTALYQPRKYLDALRAILRSWGVI